MLIRLAPALFVLLWSSSFITVKIGLQHLTPLLFVAIRLSGSAAIMLALTVALRRSWRPLGQWQWLHCAIAGALLNAVGLMPPHVGLVIAPAAQIALVQSLTPLLTALAGTVLLHETLRGRQWLGLALGVTGVGLVVGEAALENAARFQGLVLAFVGVLGLVSGTLYFGRFCRAAPLLPAATVQFLSAAAVAACGTWLLETPHVDWTAATVAAVAWNSVMVSAGGMAFYSLMLSRGTAARTTANFYLVPGTVAISGWLLLGERLSPLAVLGFVVASAGCWLVSGNASFPWRHKTSGSRADLAARPQLSSADPKRPKAG